MRLGEPQKMARESAKCKRSQLFIRTHNEAFSVVAMRVCNPDRWLFGINRCDTAPTPTGFAEIQQSTAGRQTLSGRRLFVIFCRRQLFSLLPTEPS
jgi:hypothetical protein